MFTAMAWIPQGSQVSVGDPRRPPLTSRVAAAACALHSSLCLPSRAAFKAGMWVGALGEGHRLPGAGPVLPGAAASRCPQPCFVSSLACYVLTPCQA